MTLQHNFSLDGLTTFGCRSEAQYFARVSTLEELKAALAEAQSLGIKVHLLGGGANTIAREHIRGLVLKIDIKGFDLQPHGEDEALVTVGAGEVFDDVIRRTIEAGYSGLENLSASPGTVGGAVVQNIGAYGVELAEHFVSVRIWDRQSQSERVLTLEDCDFAYRHCVFKMPKASQWVIISAVLRVTKSFKPVIGYKDVEQVLEREGLTAETLTSAKMAEIIREIRARKLPNPAEIGNAGSFFTNPIVNKVLWKKVLTTTPSLTTYKIGGGRMKIAAASLIEAAGFKGQKAGNVGVSDRHALILVNHGGATGEEVLVFAQSIQNKVEALYGVRLAMEPVVL